MTFHCMATPPTIRFGRDRQGRDRWALANGVCNSAPRRWTNHLCGDHKLEHRTVQAYIISMLLANGYWAYRPERVDVYTGPGCVPGEWPYSSTSFYHWFSPRGFWRYENYVKRAGGQPGQRPAVQYRKTEVEQCYSSCIGVWNSSWPRPSELKRRRGRAPSRNITSTADSVPRRDRIAVETRCAARRPRLQVTDDPVRNGRELAATRDNKLPSDMWRLRQLRRRDGVSIVSRDKLELQRILVVSKPDGCVDISLDDIVYDMPIYYIKVAVRDKRGRKLTPSDGVK